MGIGTSNESVAPNYQMIYTTPETQSAQVPNVHPSQRQHHVKPVNSPLYVVTPIENPHRFYSRYRLYRAFEKMCADAGAILYTVELAFRDRHFEVTAPSHPRHIQFRAPSQLWHKENLINLGISRLPADWEYVAWVDADTLFMRPDWATETIHQLQHYHVVQMFGSAVDLGPHHEVITSFKGFMKQYTEYRTPLGNPVFDKDPAKHANYCHKGKPFFHPGYAWAARRSAISDLGGLGDVAILGSGDHHMACALIGNVAKSLPRELTEYAHYWNRWQRRAERHIQRNVGYVPGTIAHYWHGRKADRKYVEKWEILRRNNFNPFEDLKYDCHGIVELSGNNIQLRDDLRAYFGLRNEDSVEMEEVR